MIDVVYIAAEQDSHEELRYSLRSVAAHLDHGRVWIVGDRPGWATNVQHVKTRQEGTVWRNSTDNLLAACRDPRISDRFVFMNDDYFILRPISEVPAHHKGLISDTHPRVTEPRSPRGQRRFDAMEGTYKLLRNWGVEGDLYDYELHVPLVVDKAGMAEVIDRARREDSLVDRLRKRSLYGNYHRIGGTQASDVTSRDPDYRWSEDQMFYSSSDKSFAEWPVGERIRRNFPDPSPYESEAA